MNSGDLKADTEAPDDAVAEERIHDLTPVVHWLTQKAGYSYESDLSDIVNSFRRCAKRLLSQYAPPDRSGREDPESLVYLALFSLQHTILDQYLPRLKVGTVRSIGCVWPWWGETGIKVADSDGCIHNLKPVPEVDGLHRLVLKDGIEYGYKLYRNETPDERRRWLQQVLTEEAFFERRLVGGGRREDQYESTEESSPRGRAPKTLENLAGVDFIRKWRSITDSSDWKLVWSKRRGPQPNDPKERKRLQRARRRLHTAYLLLHRPAADDVARGYIERLKKSEDGERGVILNEYDRRYLHSRKAIEPQTVGS